MCCHLRGQGAGKTTFARCICGLEKKAAGTLNYNGQKYSVKTTATSLLFGYAGC